jgi:DNA-binding transcriptional LysR family regulator
MHAVDRMRCFVEVIEKGSFTRAAQSLGLSKAAVSTAVSELEAHLGVRLLQRTTRLVQATSDGLRYRERARSVLMQLEELEESSRDTKSRIKGRLRVDLPVGLARNVVLPELPLFLDRHPELVVELSTTDRRVDILAEGFDCVVRVGAREDSSLIGRPLGVLELVNAASPAYLKRFGTPRRIADLEQHRIVHYAPNFGREDAFEYWDGKRYRQHKMQGVLYVNQSDAYTTACLAGLGIIQAPRFGLRAALSSGQLVEILKSYRAAPMPVTLLYPSRQYQTARFRVFVEWLEEVFARRLGPMLHHASKAARQQLPN